MKVKVDVQHVLSLRREMDRINKVPMSEIEWYDGENKLEIDPRIFEDWKMIGMSNCMFVEYGFYLEEPAATWDEREKVWKDNNEQGELGKPLIEKKSE